MENGTRYMMPIIVPIGLLISSINALGILQIKPITKSDGIATIGLLAINLNANLYNLANTVLILLAIFKPPVYFYLIYQVHLSNL